MYRFRIGSFRQKSSCKRSKFMKMFGSHCSGNNDMMILKGAKAILKMCLILILFSSGFFSPTCASTESLSAAPATCCTLLLSSQTTQPGLGGELWFRTLQSEIQLQIKGKKETF